MKSTSKIGLFALAIGILVIVFDNADIHSESTDNQLVVDNVLHDVVFLGLSEVESCVAKSDVGVIVFLRRTDIFASPDVVALGMTDHKGIRKIIKIGKENKTTEIKF